MNLPNSLTILRILLIPVFIGLLMHGQHHYALGVIIVAGITDGLDGTIARMANQRTKLGAYLDPLADKLLLTASFATLAMIHLVPLWVAILVVSRDLILLVGTLLAQLTDMRLDITPTIWGKATTLLQLAYVTLLLVLASSQMDLRLLEPLLYPMAGLTLISGFHYLYRGVIQTNASEA
jgi:cardiolipin synthase